MQLVKMFYRLGVIAEIAVRFIDVYIAVPGCSDRLPNFITNECVE